MHAKLIGIHTATKKLANGVVRAYAYTGRNGQFLCSGDGRTNAQAYERLRQKLGAPDVLAKLQTRSQNSRLAAKTTESLVAGFLGSPEFAALSSATKRDYRRYLEAFRDEFGGLSLRAFERRPEAAADVLEWRDVKWSGKPAAMDHFVRSISAMFTWGNIRRLTTAAPFSKVPRVHKKDRSDLVWTAEEISKLCQHASKQVADVVRFTAETGLRQRDVLTLTWSDLRLDTGHPPHLVRRTSKTRKQVVVPITDEARAILEGVKKCSPTVFTNSYGKPWTADGFRSSFGRAFRKAGLKGLDFHDLRGTAITRLVSLGVENAEIARIVGWAVDQVEALLTVYVGATKRDVDMLSRIKQKRDSTNR